MAVTAAQNKQLNAMKSTLSSLSKSVSSMSQSQKDQVSKAVTTASGVVSNISKSQGASKTTPVVKADAIGVTPASIPVAPTPFDPGALNLDGALGQSIVAGQYQALPPVATDTLDASNQRQQNNFMTSLQQTLGIGANDNGMADYQKMEKQAGIQKMQEQVNQYSGTLNSIVANRDAAMLGLEDQGRGQTTGFIGGEQGRINREAAIAALPVQAQLAAAQGNLEVAQARLDKLFSIHQQDVKAQYDFKVGIVNSLYQFMDKQETNRANQLIAQENQKYQEKQNNINYLRQLSSQAIQTGQQGLISRLGAIDPNSPTFEQDVAAIQSQMRLPTSTTTVKRDTQVVDGKLIDMQTGEVINDFSSTNAKASLQNNEALTLAKELLKDDAIGKSSAIGASWAKVLPDWTAKDRGFQPDRAAFESKVDTLKSNLTLDNLKLLKGAMSDKDLMFLNSIGSSLNVNMSETEFNKELQRVITKLEGAGATTGDRTGKMLTKSGLVFDVDSAKAAGYSDSEITAYINSH